MIAIVGAGVMGCATAWALGERGADVTLHEQFDLDHMRGSSHGRSRIVRLAYPQVEWIRLVEEAMTGWRELESQAGEELLALHGLIELASSRELTSADALDTCGERYELLDAEATSARGVALPPGWVALWQPEAGVVRADRARQAFLDLARARGVRVETGRRIEALDDVDADVVVVTAGGWVTKLVPDLPVRVTRETVAYFRRSGPPPPSVVELNEKTRGHAMYSLHDPVHGLKVGAHNQGTEVDPDAEAAPSRELVERASAWVAARFPGVDPEPAAVETCLYTSTADESFVLERRGRVVVGSACSGHGFKFAPVVGWRLAALALG